MAVRRDDRLTDPTRVSLLPASWGTLDQLHNLDDSALERGFAEGIIRPDMERKDVVALKRLHCSRMHTFFFLPSGTAKGGRILFRSTLEPQRATR